MFIAAIADELITTGALTALLSTYQSAPAIFTVDPAPEGAEKPFIIVGPTVDRNSFDTKTTRGWIGRVDVRIYDDANGSSEEIKAIGEAVLAALHRNPITISGYEWQWTECSGPVSADETDAYGRIVTAVIAVEKT